jgi:hypothetical protein
MANKSWLKGAEAHRGQSEIEDHKTLQWQAPITKYASAKTTMKQKMIMNTRFIFPSGGTRNVKAP